MTDTLYWFREFDAATRKRLAASGAALPDGSFPIEDAKDLRDAMRDYGRAGDKAEALAHIRRRAKALGLEKLLTPAFQASDPGPSTVHVNAPLGSSPGEDDEDESGDAPGDDEDEPSDVTIAPREPGDDGADGDDDEEESVAVAVDSPTRHFLSRLSQLLRPHVAQATLTQAVRSAAGYAGGKVRAERRTAGESDAAPPESQTEPETGAAQPLVFLEPPQWIPYLPLPGNQEHPQWGEIQISADRNSRFVQNFKSGVYQDRLPIDAEHQTKLSGALGWITDMRLNEDGSADARVDWTDRGDSLLRSDRFSSFSPEWYDTWTDPATGETHQDVAIGGALTTRPFFKGRTLRPLAASEHALVLDYRPARSQAQAENQNQAGSPESEEARQMADGDSAIAEQAHTSAADHMHTHDDGTTHHHDHSHAAGSADHDSPTHMKSAAHSTRPADGDNDEDDGNSEGPTTMTETATEQTRRFAEVSAERDQLRQMTERQATEIKAMSERLGALESAARQKRFGELADGWYGDPAEQVTFLEKLAKSFGEESPEFTSYVERQRALGEQLRQSNLFHEMGRPGGAPATSGARLEAEAKRFRESDPTLSAAAAMERALAANPDLYDAYRLEVLN